jgi:hypothetical protein
MTRATARERLGGIGAWLVAAARRACSTARSAVLTSRADDVNRAAR